VQYQPDGLRAISNGVAKWVAVFVLIGCCIDIGKYLFWAQRQRSHYYGLLSLLLEISTLGMISRQQAIRVEMNESDTPEDNSEINDSEAEIQQSIAQLTNDILLGRVQPVLRKIRAARYGLDIDIIRQVLRGLHSAGVLEADKRNSYKLCAARILPGDESPKLIIKSR